MVKPIDLLFGGPSRTVIANQDGTWTIIVLPPAWAQMESYEQRVILTEEQYQRFKRWIRGELLIQNALPDLSPDDREILMTGIGPQEWNEKFKDEED